MSLNPTDSGTVLAKGTTDFAFWILYLVNNIIYVGPTVHTWSSSVQGGPGGRPFDDFNSARGAVTEIRVWGAQYIDAIQVVYKDDVGPKHGGSGGQSYTFSLGNDEKIVRIDGRGTKYIDQLQFFTNKGDFF